VVEEYKRKCDETANKNPIRSKKHRVAGENISGEIEAEEEEAAVVMEAEWHLPATQEVNA
jgi:hypothetical protein